MIYVTSKKRKPSFPLKLVLNNDNKITNSISIATYFNNYFVTIGEKLSSSIPVFNKKYQMFVMFRRLLARAF